MRSSSERAPPEQVGREIGRPLGGRASVGHASVAGCLAAGEGVEPLRDRERALGLEVHAEPRHAVGRRVDAHASLIGGTRAPVGQRLGMQALVGPAHATAHLGVGGDGAVCDGGRRGIERDPLDRVGDLGRQRLRQPELAALERGEGRGARACESCGLGDQTGSGCLVLAKRRRELGDE